MGENDVDNFYESKPFEQQNLELLFPREEGNIQQTR